MSQSITGNDPSGAQAVIPIAPEPMLAVAVAALRALYAIVYGSI